MKMDVVSLDKGLFPRRVSPEEPPPKSFPEELPRRAPGRVSQSVS